MTVRTMSYQNLFAGDFPQARDSVEIGAGQNLSEGAVLGKKTATAGVKEKLSFGLSAFTAPSAGTQAEFSFALSALTPGNGTVTLAIADGAEIDLSYPVTTTSASTIDSILTAIAALVNADAACPLSASANTTDDKLELEANAIGVEANDYTITLIAATVVLTIGAKTVVTAGSAADPAGSVTLAISDASTINLSYETEVTSISTVDSILAALAAQANADTACPFEVTANTTADKLELEANTVGTWPNDYSVAMSKSDVTLTIGVKTVVTAGVDFAKGEFFIVDSTKTDGTENPVAMLLENVETGAEETKFAIVTYTGDVSAEKLSFGGTDTIATHIDAMRDHCLFIKNNTPVIGA